MAKVYSYLRFSDPKQAAGSSADRQLEYAARWAAEKGLALDESLSLRDEGLSAFHQRHIKVGALGVFLRAVEDGKVDSGSVLVVEGLDRLSRAEPILAQAQLAQIVNAGITVITASDGKEYNRERLKAQPMDLVYSLLVMIRAHEESDTKSKRVRAAIRRQCEGWQAGTWRGLIRNGKDPQWLTWNGQAFIQIEDRVEAIQYAAARYLEGYGLAAIVSEMYEREIGYTDQGLTNSTHLSKTLKNRMLVGEKSLTVDSIEYRLAGYYPAIFTPDYFAELQIALARRSRIRGPGTIPSILTGLRVSVCGNCGSGIVAQTLLTRKRQPDGRVWPGHRRLNCSHAMAGRPCTGGPSIQAGPVERAILLYCADPHNLAGLAGGDDKAASIRADLASIRRLIHDSEEKLARIAGALATDDGTPPATLLRTMRDLEAKAAGYRQEMAGLEDELITYRPNADDDSAEKWLALIDGVDRLDVPSLMAARELIRSSFEQIRIWRSGTQPGDAEDGVVEIEIKARRGGMIRLRLEKRSGAKVD